MSEELLLKWNEHHNLFCVGAEELCEREEYTDVTLAAGTEFFPAHKLVLSICSPYFKHLFKHLGKEKSVIFLKDVDPTHLDLLLQYMYKGEIKVQESELVNVLSTAQALDIKGLSDQSSLKNEVHAASSPEITQPVSMVPGFDKNIIPLKKQRTVQTSIRISEEGSSTQAPSTSHKLPEIVPVKQEISKVAEDLDQSRSEHFGDKDDGVGQDIVYVDTSIDAGYGDLEHYDDAMGDIDQQGVGWAVAGKPSSMGNVVCNYCGKEYRHMSALKTHLPVHTGEKRFECKGCGRRFTQISSLNKHMKIKNCSPLDALQQQWNTSH